MQELTISSPAFAEGGLIPLKHTGYGEDVSPELRLDGLQEDAVSMAVIMNDMDHPVPAYNHWVIWNLPAMSVIPEHTPHGTQIEVLGKAVVMVKTNTAGQNPRFTGHTVTTTMSMYWTAVLNCPCRKKT